MSQTEEREAWPLETEISSVDLARITADSVGPSEGPNTHPFNFLSGTIILNLCVRSLTSKNKNISIQSLTVRLSLSLKDIAK